MKFIVDSQDAASQARAGRLSTGHGEVHTPAFMPVGTAGTVKGVHQRELTQDIHAGMILGNAYHLYLRPGTALIQQAGGLHKFIGWSGPMLTDSGGYQVYSLSGTDEKNPLRVKMNEDGVSFRSHIDGSLHFFSPEVSMDIQRAIGADVVMAFDECMPYPCDHTYASRSLDMTHRWLARCVKRFSETECAYGYEQALFPIVQGGVFRDLRIKSAETVLSFDSVGYAIGGLSVGEPAADMYAMTEAACSILPREKPRYLMGVGTPENILESIALGIDMFDCVMPTRNARNGMLFTREGIVNIRNEKWKNDLSPVDEHGTCFADREYSRAYLRHLFVAGEMLGPQIASIHNLAFYTWLAEEAGRQIKAGSFSAWKKQMVEKVTQRL